jgi:predicted PurR-regulated permease PerM
MPMQISSTEKYFLFILLSITIILTLVILYPFLSMLVLTAAFAVILNPIYLWIKKYIARNISWLASLLTIIIFISCLCVPLFFVGKAIFSQAQNMYITMVNSQNSSTFIESINTSINKTLPAGFNFDIHSKIADLASSITNNLAKIFSSTLNSVAMFMLMIFSLFYLLMNGEKWKEELMNIIPLSDENTNEILKNLKRSIDRVIKGSFIIAIVQAFLAWVGFTIFGVPNAIIWAIVTGMASFVPTVGTSIITVPAMLFLYATGMQLQALGLLIWALIAVGTIDNVLSPYIISKDTSIPSLFVLFGILGGISFFGPLGILIGPLIISLLYSLVSIYKKQIKS